MNLELKLLEKNVQLPPDKPIITPAMLQTATSLSVDKENVKFEAFFNAMINRFVPHFVTVVANYANPHVEQLEALSGKTEEFDPAISEKESKEMVHNFASNFRPNQTKSYLAQLKLLNGIVRILFKGLDEPKNVYKYNDLLDLMDEIQKCLQTLLDREFQLAAIVMKSYMMLDAQEESSKDDIVFAALKRLSEKIGELAKSAGYTLVGNHQVEGDFDGFDEFIDKVNNKLQSATNLTSDKLRFVSVESADDDFSFDVNIIFDSDDQEAVNKLVMWYYVDKITEFGTNIGADMS